MNLYFLIGSALLAVAASQGDKCQLPNCNSCEDKGPQCLSCPATKTLNNNRDECLACPAKCVNCINDGKDVTVCVTCESGYYLEAGCNECMENCKKCSKDKTVETCNECEAGFSVKDGTCQGCAVDKYKDSKTGSCKGCPSNAMSCADDGTGTAKVIACKEDFVPNVDDADATKSSTMCYTCPKECKKCDGKLKTGQTSKCTECNLNLYLQDGVCGACETDKTVPSDKCITCDATGKCTECNTKYVANDGNCKDCAKNCDGCSYLNSDTKCDTCAKNYGLNTGLTCDVCPSNCKECEFNDITGTSCTTCKDGFGKNDKGVCTACPGSPSCKTCSWATTLECSACIDGFAFFATDKTCKQCPTLCKICNYPAASPAIGDEICTECLDTKLQAIGLKKTDINQCRTLPTNCKTLDAAAALTETDVICATCVDGFFLDGTAKTCLVECPSNCNECTASVAACDATKCKEGFVFLSTAKTCTSCETVNTGFLANCGTCTVTEGTGGAAHTVVCTVCKTGYAGPTGTATECLPCPNDCTECTHDATTTPKSTKCITAKCKDKYTNAYANGAATGLCTGCPSNCAKCTSTTAGVVTCDADECATGTNKNSEGKCEACPLNCATCALNAGTLECSVCKDKYGLTAAKECKDCASSCKTCKLENSILVCSLCIDGYSTSKAQCTACPGNCAACDYDTGTMICNKCAEKNTLVTGECQKCPANCDECSSITKCNKGKCTPGYGQNSAGACVVCSTITFDSCARCSDHPGSSSNDTAKCTSCMPNYTLKNGLQSGPGSGCNDVSSLQCGLGVAIVDKPAQCSASGCTEGTVINSDYLCARTCYACGDLATNTYVNAADCDSTNGSAKANPVQCTTGGCYGKSSKDSDGNIKVITGCRPENLKCVGVIADVEKGLCKNVGQNNECDKCCTTAENCNGFVDKVKAHSSASTNVVSFLMILIVTIASGNL